jgi:hypothetical protein
MGLFDDRASGLCIYESRHGTSTVITLSTVSPRFGLRCIEATKGLFDDRGPSHFE